MPHVGSMIEGITVTVAGDEAACKTDGDWTAIMSPLEVMELSFRDNQGIITYKCGDVQPGDQQTRKQWMRTALRVMEGN